MKFRELLGGLPVGRTAKVIDGQHPRGASRDNDTDELKPDLLPLPEGQNGRNGQCKRNILVAISGCALDREVMTLACKVAKDKKAPLYAVYGIEVPRTKTIDDEMPEQTENAHKALDQAAAVAEQLSMDIEPEIVQSRHFGHSLVDEAEAHDCALLIMGLPYRIGLGGKIEGSDTLDYVLRHAPCKVWIVRGQPPEKAQELEHETSERVERSVAAR